jgi:sugar lactone lactonase YvrE
VTNGDGILLDGQTLYVVRTRNKVIAVVDLDLDTVQGDVVGEIADPAFDVPTTIAEFGDGLHVVNGRFGVADPENTAFSVNRVSKGASD